MCVTLNGKQGYLVLNNSPACTPLLPHQPQGQLTLPRLQTQHFDLEHGLRKFSGSQPPPFFSLESLRPGIMFYCITSFKGKRRRFSIAIWCLIFDEWISMKENTHWLPIILAWYTCHACTCHLPNRALMLTVTLCAPVTTSVALQHFKLLKRQEHQSVDYWLERVECVLHRDILYQVRNCCYSLRNPVLNGKTCISECQVDKKSTGK